MDFDFSVESITPTQTTSVTIVATGSLGLPVGTVAQRPANAAGLLRWNSDNVNLEYNTGSAWAVVGSVTSVATTQPAAGFTVTGGPITTTGTLVFTLANDLAALEGLGSTGFAARTTTDTWAQRTLTAPAAGFTITNPAGVAGDPTFVLANDLGAVEGLSTNGVAVRTATDTWTTRTITGTASNISVTNGDGVSGNPTINLVTAGTPVTAQFLRITTDTFGRVTATSSVTNSDITTALGYTPLNQAGDSMTAGFLTLFQDPTSAMHAVTKQYVDNISAGLDPKGSVRAATTANITLSAPQTIDGVSVIAGDRVLVKNQTTGSQNGIYVAAAGSWTRSTDADSSAEVTSGQYVFVEEGTAAGGTGWVLTTANPITLNTTSLTYSQFSGAGTYVGANGIQVTGTTVQTDSASNLRSLHTLATNGLIARTASGTVAARTLTAPAAGMTVTNGDGVAGNPTLVLANDLGAVEGLSTTGVAVRTATDTWTTRTITGTTNTITITNGDGVSGAPTITVADNAVLPGTTHLVLPTGTNAQETGTTNGGVRYDSQSDRNRQRYGGTWRNVGIGDGTVTSITVTGSTGLTVGGSPITTTGTVTLTLGTELQGLSGLASTGFVVRTGAGTYANRSFVAGTAITLSNTDGVSGNITITNNGVTALAGTTNQITASASTGSVTLSLPSTLVAPGYVAVTGALYQSLSAAVSAAGSTQGTATAITASYNVVTTVAASTGVVLPTPVTPFGFAVTVVNRGANALTVYPQSGGSIDGGTTNAGVVVPVNEIITLVGTSATAWFTADPVIVAGAGITVTPSAGTLTIAATAASLAIIKENPSSPTTPLVAGTNAVAIGSGSSASTTGSFANGDGTSSRLAGGKVLANGKFATAGDAQVGQYVVRNSTTNATATDLFMDGSSAKIVLPANSVFMFEAYIVGRRTDATGGSAGYVFEGVMKQDATASTTAIIGSISKTIVAETNSAWDATITADTTNGGFKITVTGEAAKTIRWVGYVQTVEVTN